MRDQILKAVSRSRVDFADIRVEHEWRTNVQYLGPKLESLEAPTDRWGIVRCLVNVYCFSRNWTRPRSRLVCNRKGSFGHGERAKDPAPGKDIDRAKGGHYTTLGP